MIKDRIKEWLDVKPIESWRKMVESRLAYLQRITDRQTEMERELGAALDQINQLHRTLGKMQQDYQDIIASLDTVGELRRISERARRDLSAAEAAGFDRVADWRKAKAERQAEELKVAEIYSPDRNKLSPLPDGLGYYWCNLMPPDFRQVNIRDEGQKTDITNPTTNWVAYVGGKEVSSGHESKEQAFTVALRWASENREVEEQPLDG